MTSDGHSLFGTEEVPPQGACFQDRKISSFGGAPWEVWIQVTQWTEEVSGWPRVEVPWRVSANEPNPLDIGDVEFIFFFSVKSADLFGVCYIQVSFVCALRDE